MAKDSADDTGAIGDVSGSVAGGEAAAGQKKTSEKQGQQQQQQQQRRRDKKTNLESMLTHAFYFLAQVQCFWCGRVLKMGGEWIVAAQRHASHRPQV